MIESTPTLVFLREDGEEYFRWNGFRPGQENAAVITEAKGFENLNWYSVIPKYILRFGAIKG